MIFLGFAMSFSCFSSNKKMETGVASGNGFAVVELFTSEGCSSCPPADAAVAAILKEYPGNVYVLGYHVDYWDRYGWKDVFSNVDYSRRQSSYAKRFELSSIYTPQVIVNGKEQFVGSDKIKLHNSINNEMKHSGTANLKITAAARGGEIIISYETNATGNLNIALVQLQAQNKIERGENHGATLHHVNIVRDIKTIPLKTGNGKATLNLPNGLFMKDCRVIAFTQNENNLEITSAAQADIE